MDPTWEKRTFVFNRHLRVVSTLLTVTIALVFTCFHFDIRTYCFHQIPFCSIWVKGYEVRWNEKNMLKASKLWMQGPLVVMNSILHFVRVYTNVKVVYTNLSIIRLTVCTTNICAKTCTCQFFINLTYTVNAIFTYLLILDNYLYPIGREFPQQTSNFQTEE